MRTVGPPTSGAPMQRSVAACLASILELDEARNAALALVATEFVCFLDADDELIGGTLRGLTRVMREQAELVCAADSYGYWDGGDGPVRRGPWPATWAYRLQTRPRLLAVACGWRNAIPVTGPALLRVGAARQPRAGARREVRTRARAAGPWWLHLISSALALAQLVDLRRR